MNTKEEIVFADGVKVTNPFPEIIKLSINTEKFIDFLTAYKNEKGYVNIDILKSRNKDAYYAKLNTWQPKKKLTDEELNEIPF